MRQLGNLYMQDYGDFGKAYEYLATGIQLSEENKVWDQLPYLYMSMSSLYGADSRARSKKSGNETAYMARAYNAATRHKVYDALPGIVVNMCWLRNQGYDSFTQELEEFERATLPADLPKLAFARLYLKAHRAYMRKDYRQAEEFYRQAIEKIVPTGYSERYLITATIQEADMRKKGGDVKGAKDILLQYVQYAKKRKMMDHLMQLYLHLADCYTDIGMTDSADYYSLQYFRTREALKEHNMPDMGELTLSRQIESVNSDLKESSIVRQKREKQLLMAAAAGGLLLIVAAALFWALRSQRRNARQLFLQNRRLLDAVPARQESISNVAETSEAPPATNAQNAEKDTESPLGVDPKIADDVYRQIIDVMENSDDVYAQGFNVGRLAELTGFSLRLVSQVINQKSGSSFSRLLTEYRIREASRRLLSPRYDNFTVEGVAMSVGIQSRSTFTHTFKKVTGLTPAEFRRQGRRV